MNSFGIWSDRSNRSLLNITKFFPTATFFAQYRKRIKFLDRWLQSPPLAIANAIEELIEHAQNPMCAQTQQLWHRRQCNLVTQSVKWRGDGMKKMRRLLTNELKCGLQKCRLDTLSMALPFHKHWQSILSEEQSMQWNANERLTQLESMNFFLQVYSLISHSFAVLIAFSEVLLIVEGNSFFVFRLVCVSWCWCLKGWFMARTDRLCSEWHDLCFFLCVELFIARDLQCRRIADWNSIRPRWVLHFFIHVNEGCFPVKRWG